MGVGGGGGGGGGVGEEEGAASLSPLGTVLSPVESNASSGFSRYVLYIQTSCPLK